jgi:hypothetical protein
MELSREPHAWKNSKVMKEQRILYPMLSYGVAFKGSTFINVSLLKFVD